MNTRSIPISPVTVHPEFTRSQTTHTPSTRLANCLAHARLLGPLSCLLLLATACQTQESVRVATFNLAMSPDAPGTLSLQLDSASNAQGQSVAEILQRTRPDVVVLTSIDLGPDGAHLDLLIQNYLSVGQVGLEPLSYPHRYLPPGNSGVPSGVDLNGNGILGEPADALGWGLYPGQYGMAILSRYPIRESEVRNFQRFLWKDMPDAILPDDPTTEASGDRLSTRALEVLPLASRAHVDLPIETPEGLVHVLAAYPISPLEGDDALFSAARNHDELRFWADYIVPEKSEYIYDDAGLKGGLPADMPFVLAGSLGADPFDGESKEFAARQLVFHDSIHAAIATGALVPQSEGALEYAALEPELSSGQAGDPQNDTTSEGLREDYVLPARALEIQDSGVFWPATYEARYALVAEDLSSNHRLVYCDVLFPAEPGARDWFAGLLGH